MSATWKPLLAAVAGAMALAVANPAFAAGDDEPREEAPTGPPAQPMLQGVARTLAVGGGIRGFALYVPDAVERSMQRVPLVVALHGGWGTADRMQRYMQLNEVAQAERFIVAYPQGVGNSWNDGRPDAVRWRSSASRADDVSFLDALAAELAGSRLVDASRIYLTGLSNGGFMTSRMACEKPDRFAAFAVMLSSLPAGLAERCRPARPIPMLMIAGTQDGLVPWRGMEKGGYRILPVLEQAQFWARHNGCGTVDEQRLNDVDRNDGSTLIWASWSGCRPGGATELYGVDGGGHQVPSMRRSASDFLIGAFLGPRNRDMETGEVLWQFFKRFRLHAH